MMTSRPAFVSVPSRAKMLFRQADVAAYLEAQPELRGKVVIHSTDAVGFIASVGEVKNERFDLPFNGEAFFEILA